MISSVRSALQFRQTAKEWWGCLHRGRMTFDALMDGDIEKQVALRTELSRTTVHRYVTTLYRCFGGADSRGAARQSPASPRPGAWTLQVT
jgi:hypothetical protein